MPLALQVERRAEPSGGVKGGALVQACCHQLGSSGNLMAKLMPG
jgi:hypothetical protein